MRVQFSWLSAAALSFVLMGCSAPPPPAPTPPAEEAAPSGPVHSRGVVFAVTREYDAITIQHDPIPAYGMDAMVMEFTVANPSELDGIDVGDTVTFELSGPLDIATISEVDGN